jgi:TonB family protein
MTRLETKCIVGACGVHGLLLGVVLASAAFQGQPQKEEHIQILNIIPSKLLDQVGSGGGTPQPSPTPTPPTQAEPAAQPKQEVAQQKPVEQKQVEQKPDPKPVEKEIVKTETIPDPPKKQVKHHQIEPDITELQPIESPNAKVHIAKPTKHLRSADDIHVDLGQKTSVKNHRKQDLAKQQAADDEASAVAYNNSVKRALSKIGSEAAHSIGSKTSGLTVVGKLGQGGGGEAFAGYEQAVGSIYYRAWVAPEGVGDGGSDTEVEIVVARDGTIISAQLTTHSGKSSMDRSVQSVLNKVRKLPPFPEGASDTQRTFQIVFNLKAKHSSG